MNNLSMRNVGIVTLSPTEASIVRGTKGSIIDVKTQSKRTQALVDQFAKCKVKTQLEDGTEVEATIEELIVMKSLMAEVVKPRGFQSILDFQKVRGELVEANNANVNVSLVDQDLAKRAVGK